MKTYYFISGLPRSGSTLFSSIMRQNPEFYADISSPIQKLAKVSIECMTICENKFTLTENHRKNILLSLFEGYYKNIDKPVIFDTSRDWTKHTTLLKELFPYTKIICCVRDIPYIINSFELINKKNPLYSFTIVNSENENDVFSRCDDMMNTVSGIISSSWVSLKEGYSINPEMIHFVEYDKLCKNPEKEIKLVYKFLDKPYYENHDFENLEYSNENFDISCNLKDLHTVRKKITYKEQKRILPPEIWERYQSMNMEFWKKEYIPNINILKELDKKFIEYK
jgi:sulfotransferase